MNFGMALSSCVISILLTVSLWAQAPVAPSQQIEPPTVQESKPAPQTPAQPAAGQSQTSPAPKNEPEQKITPEQAQELFRDVDEILKFDSQDTDLPIKHEVKRRLTTRDEVVAYLEKTMAEDKDAQRLRRSELVLKKFGLVPQDFDLENFLVSLLREQVAGYYDSKTKTVNLLDWLGADQQRPVLAHELTHALQDQSFDLEKWMEVGDKDIDDVKHPSAQDFEDDEISEARQAVVEGQAMVTLLDYELKPTGQSLLTSPEVVKTLEQGMLLGSADSPEFQNAPVYMKEALTFPYRYGLEFAAALLKHGGRQQAFAGAFENPPRTTRQIMEPQTYLSGEQLPPMPLADFDRDFKNYERFDLGAIGEFDVAILIDQYAGTEASHNLYPDWRGGYYYSVHPKGDANAPLGMLYVSRWSSPAKAQEFAAVYAKGLNKRYRHVHEVNGEGNNNQNFKSFSGKRSWLTEQGPVVIDCSGDVVVITESLDQNTSDALDTEIDRAGTPSEKRPAQ